MRSSRDRLCHSFVVPEDNSNVGRQVMDEAQAARTESTFREVNEAIAETAARFDADVVDFVCECADPNCAHRVTADVADYERIRADGTHFLVAPGHDEHGFERVVRRARGYHVVEKCGRTVAAIARRLNPRRRPA
jgi:hypothetical protein